MNPIKNSGELAVDTINQIQLAIKSTGVYPEDHPLACDIISKSYETLLNHLETRDRIDVSVNGGKLLVDDQPVESGNNNLSANFALDLNQRAVSSISFYRGLSRHDFMVFIKAMNQKPQSQGKDNELQSYLKSKGVSGIRLNGVRYKKILDEQDEASQGHTINQFHLNEDLKESPGAHESTGFEPGAKNRLGGAHQQRSIFEHIETTEDGTEDIPGVDFPGTEKKANATDRKNSASGKNESHKDYFHNLLSQGNSAKVEEVIDGLSRKMNDKSHKIRQKVAESLQDITATLDELDKLNENFKKISESLINWIKNESHADTYLSVTKNLYHLCSLQNKMDCYLIDDTIGGRLFEAKKLPKQKLQEALNARKKNGNSLQHNLGALSLVEESVLTQFLAQQYQDCRVVNLSRIIHVTDSILRTIPEKYIERYRILPFETKYGKLYIATLNPNDWQAFRDLQFISGYPIVPHLAAEYFLFNSIEKFYHTNVGPSPNQQPPANNEFENWSNELEFIEDKEEPLHQTEELKDSDVPIIRLVNMIIKEAIDKKASDIHIEPFENELRVRFRIDGSLITALSPSPRYTSGLASRIKIMSGMDISERRRPQDGRFKVQKDGKYVTFRVSTFPASFGEKIVLRLLDDANLALNIDQLGLNEADFNILQSAMHRTNGMILVTGPTGSGKTTTIYSVLRSLNDGSQNITTAEDPIEYSLKGINQFQMNPKIGLNFASALKTFLRQDPDIIMVGEIRDYETAEIAFKAALTGHLVLSTLHTNNAPETITRLINMGVEPYIITSSINLIVAQRLLRKICEHCKVPATPTDLQASIIENRGLALNGYRFFQGEGCEECCDTGYKGRTAVYEVMPLQDEVKEYIIKGKSTAEIRSKAEEQGLGSLQAQGFQKVATGVTSLSEWIRVLA